MEVTVLLKRLHTRDESALHSLMPLIYTELRKLASFHLRGRTGRLQEETTSLVHEAFLRLAKGGHPLYENRTHFYGVASRVMRQVLVDLARARFAQKRGAALEVLVASLPDAYPQPDRMLLALNDALQQLERVDILKCRLIEMRFFGGMTAEECSTELSLPVHVVRRELRLAQAWLRRGMAEKPFQTPLKTEENGAAQQRMSASV